ncbi:hypothetical protein GLE_1620 [Lysobacter enzymogenes]|uniref:Uncharacterized protein n=1 Tax=Lysobacter enzymogenes TaxID=69 RepID=A0A0S2DEM8_LYSEN|nr:hypothetical protein GLE_1620 [Lysobacter enzymogenes]
MRRSSLGAARLAAAEGAVTPAAAGAGVGRRRGSNWGRTAPKQA